MSRKYACPNTGAWVRINDDDTVNAYAYDSIIEGLPLGLIHRALEREGYTVVIEKRDDS